MAYLEIMNIDLNYFFSFLNSRLKAIIFNNHIKYTEDDIQVIYEPSKYIYDYTYSNPIVLAEGYNTTSIKSDYTYLNDRII